jgi:hypothetical protein
MSKLRKALILVWAVAMAASSYGWLRYSGVIMTRTAQPNPPIPFVGLEAGTKDKDFTVVTVRVRPILVPHEPIRQQEPETITIDEMVARP